MNKTNNLITAPLKYRKLKKKHFWDRQMYQILAPLEYTTRDGIHLKIDTGFILDFASTPFWIHWLFPPIGWYAKAVAFHDLLYHDHHGKTRYWADAIMREIMVMLAEYLTGIPMAEGMQEMIDTFYFTVRKHGKKAWNKGNKGVGKKE